MLMTTASFIAASSAIDVSFPVVPQLATSINDMPLEMLHPLFFMSLLPGHQEAEDAMVSTTTLVPFDRKLILQHGCDISEMLHRNQGSV